MSFSPNKKAVAAGAVLLGTGLIAVGSFMAGPAEQNIVHRDIAPRCAENSYHGEYCPDCSEQEVSGMKLRLAAPSAEMQAVRNFTAVDIKLPAAENNDVRSKKADISSYTMLLQNDAPVEVPAEPAAAAVTEAEASAGNAAPEPVPTAFDAVYPGDNTPIYDEKPERQEIKGTRSVAGESFSIYDIISGSYRTVGGHELLCQMVYNEIGSDWDDEAIKAQTVAAYSYLRFCKGIGFTAQIGMKAGYPERLENLVSSVEGQAVFYNGEIINAVYSASTAGFSVESERIWDMEYPYLRCVVSEYDCEDPYYGLETVLNKYDVKAALENVCGITLSDNAENWFRMEDIYSGRYVGYINVDGQKRITCRTLQDTFDLQSQAVRVEISGDDVIFRTFGWGHGVGMSQWGCCGYAKHGWSYDQILRHYYVGTEVKLS
ncbi:MAG: SpoIID/LytB domain-containing protein [Ruminococcus sp.]|nr:SpoIID/LytB domain-containing protein [Ruminococcus sp.]